MTPTDDIFWKYLSPILDEQKAESGIVYAKMSDANGMDRIIGDSRSEDVYPGIFVMRPKYRGNILDNALLLALFELTLFVFFKGDTDDHASEDQAYHNSETVACKIVNRLQHDRFAGKNYLDFDSITLEPVQYQTGVDATCGYELKARLGIPANHIFC